MRTNPELHSVIKKKKSSNENHKIFFFPVALGESVSGKLNTTVSAVLGIESTMGWCDTK